MLYLDSLRSLSLYQMKLQYPRNEHQTGYQHPPIVGDQFTAEQLSLESENHGLKSYTYISSDFPHIQFPNRSR